MSYEKVLELINEGDAIKAFEVLPQKLRKESVGLIIKKFKLSQEETVSLLFEAFLLVSDRIKVGGFEYRDDKQFDSYFKKTCISTALNYVKLQQGASFLISSEQLVNEDEALKNLYYEELEEVYQNKEDKYEISFERDDREESFKQLHEKNMINAFHLIKDECKLLIILRDVMKRNHEEIVSILSPFFKIGSPAVCRTKLARCRKALKDKTNAVPNKQM